MSGTRDIKRALSKICERNEELYGIPCKVDSVDVTAKTCYCIPIETGKADLMDVRLMVDTTKNGFLIIPKVGSIVFVSMINNEAGYVSYFSEVEEIDLNGTNYGGIPIVQNLVNKLNALENAFNQHILTYNAHTHPETSVNTLVPTPLDTQVLIDTTTAELANTTVFHGNG